MRESSVQTIRQIIIKAGQPSSSGPTTDIEICMSSIGSASPAAQALVAKMVQSVPSFTLSDDSQTLGDKLWKAYVHSLHSSIENQLVGRHC